jgi:hypothetical protein
VIAVVAEVAVSHELFALKNVRRLVVETRSVTAGILLQIFVQSQIKTHDTCGGLSD